MMLGEIFGPDLIIVVVVIAVVIFGGSRIPKMARSLGRQSLSSKKASRTARATPLTKVARAVPLLQRRPAHSDFRAYH